MNRLRFKSKYIVSFLLMALLLSSVMACSQQDSEPEPLPSPKAGEESKLEAFIGNHARVTWIQEQGGGSDTLAFGENFKLMGLDSRDDKGERALLEKVANYYKPIFTPDGKYVIVSDRVHHQMIKVEFVSGKNEALGDGVAVATWKDPKSDNIWVYAFDGEGGENKYLTTKQLIRFSLNKPEKRELVWNKSHMSWSNLDISRDGKTLGGLFPWPHASFLDIENEKLSRVGRGCWTSQSPDNNRILWVFDGLHRNLSFVHQDTGRKWTTQINGGPSMEGYEVYHPKWSNHFNFFAITGPYLEGEGGNKIGGGGKKVEIHLGKFANDLKSVDIWHTVTNNQLADFYPSLWVADSASLENPFVEDTVKPVVAKALPQDWPVASQKMIFLWQDFKSDNQLPERSLVGFQQLSVIPSGKAIFNEYNEMDLRGDGFVAGDTELAGQGVLKKNNYIGVEFLFTPESGVKKGTIFSYANRDKNNVTLLQNGDGVVLNVRISADEQIVLKSPEIMQDKVPMHLFTEVSNSNVALYVNGKNVVNKKITKSPLLGWEKGLVVFGDPRKNQLGLNGAISKVAIYGEKLDEAEIVHNSQLVLGGLVERKDIPFVQLRGELVEQSQIPEPDSLGAYSRALVVNRYLVKKVLEGEYSEKEILVAEWAVLDREIIEEASARKLGDKETLHVELFDDHQELEGERLMMDMFDPDLEVYYAAE